MARMQRRFVSELSWASEMLRKKGEALTPVEVMPPLIEFTTELFLRPTPYVKNLVDRVLELNAVETHQLSEKIRIRVGLSDAEMNGSVRGKGKKKSGDGEGAAAAVAVVAEPVKEKEFFDLKLGAVDPKSKIKIIKEIRTITSLGLKEVM